MQAQCEQFSLERNQAVLRVLEYKITNANGAALALLPGKRRTKQRSFLRSPSNSDRTARLAVSLAATEDKPFLQGVRFGLHVSFFSY